MSNRKLRELKKQYQYSKQRGYGVPAQVAGEELDRIQRENEGKLRVSDVVDASRTDDAPLHPAFEWDDWKAAEEHRQQQARNLIRAISVVAEDAPPHKAHYSVTVADEAKPVYVSAEAVVESASLFADAISRLDRVLQQARRSVEELEQLAKKTGDEPERLARIALAYKAIEAAGAAVASLH